MTDITELFRHVAVSAGEDPTRETVEHDIERGHFALTQVRRRRTYRALAGVTAVAAVAGVVAVVAVGTQNDGSTPPHRAIATSTRGPHSSPPQTLSVKLVAYTGTQLAGFTVDRVPDGWNLSTSTESALTITAQGDPNDDPDVFIGKLTVLLQSPDAQGLPDGEAVTVNGNPGVVYDGGEQILTYADGAGHTVVVQTPPKLGWSSAQIVSFAEGVHVTGNAVAGRG